jgi:hypothetical protein
MAKSDQAVGVDLAELEMAGTKDWPAISAGYQAALSKCNDAISAMGGSTRTAEGLNQMISQAYIDLLRLTVGFLTTTKSTLDDASTALANGAKEYAASDDAIKASFESMLQEMGGGNN